MPFSVFVILIELPFSAPKPPETTLLIFSHWPFPSPQQGSGQCAPEQPRPRPTCLLPLTRFISELRESSSAEPALCQAQRAEPTSGKRRTPAFESTSPRGDVQDAAFTLGRLVLASAWLPAGPRWASPSARAGTLGKPQVPVAGLSKGAVRRASGTVSGRQRPAFSPPQQREWAGVEKSGLFCGA